MSCDWDEAHYNIKLYCKLPSEIMLQNVDQCRSGGIAHGKFVEAKFYLHFGSGSH